MRVANRPAFFPALQAAALSGLALGAGGCATPGPNHVYTFSRGQTETIRDFGPADTVNVPTFTTAEDGVTGLAYDPYTDHLFLRLAPGNRIRVVDRPDRSIKREFTIPELASLGGGDLAVRPRDGHLYFACAAQPFIIEADRFGNFVRRIELEGLKGEVIGLAYDAGRNRLLVAANGALAELRVHAPAGKLLQSSPLGFPGVTSLAYDATNRELHAVVPGEPGIVVLNEEGQVLRKTPAGDLDFLDLGQRSFVRVF